MTIQNPPARWYHHIGPFHWYRQEWWRLEIEVAGRYYGVIWLRAAGQWVFAFGGRVVKRSLFGGACCIDGGVHFTL